MVWRGSVLCTVVDCGLFVKSSTISALLCVGPSMALCQLYPFNSDVYVGEEE